MIGGGSLALCCAIIASPGHPRKAWAIRAPSEWAFEQADETVEITPEGLLPFPSDGSIAAVINIGERTTWYQGSSTPAIMTAAGGDLQLPGSARAGRAIDQPMLLSDPAGPEASQIAAQWLRLADALERRAVDITDQLVDQDQDCLVLRLPEQMVGPRRVA